jgi:hypothetical protein
LASEIVRILRLVALFVCALAAPALSRASIVLTSVAPTYNQDFNGLASSVGTWSTVPANWEFSESGSGADATYTADDGNSSTADTFSFGPTGGSDRALGTVRGTTPFANPLFSTIGAKFSNGAQSAFASLEISYRGEQWRLGTTDRGPDRLDFQYSLNATSLSTGTWADFDALDFVAPQTTGGPMLDGNQAGNFANVAATINNLTIAPSSVFWIRWTDFSAIGSDDGLAVDDFQITAHSAAVPESGGYLFGAVAGGLAAGWTILRRLLG